MLLAQLSSKQIAEWMAFGMLEQVGNPVPPDPEAVAAAKRKTQRQNFEAGMKALMTRSKDGNR
jgi:hypothetical protein